MKAKHITYNRYLGRGIALMMALCMAAATPAHTFAEPQAEAGVVQDGEAAEAAEAIAAAVAAPEDDPANAENPEGDAAANPENPEGDAAANPENPEGDAANPENPEGDAAANPENPEGDAAANPENPEGEAESASEAAVDTKKYPPLTEALSLVFENPDIIPYGVKVGEIEIGGMTVEEAKATVNAHFQTIADSAFTVNVHETPLTLPVSSFGYEWTLGNEIDEAVKVGKTGGMLTRYRELTDLYYAGSESHVETRINKDAVDSFVAEQILPLNTEPQNATIYREDGAFVVTPEVLGLSTSQEATVNVIAEALSGENPVTNVDAVVDIVVPEIRAEQLNTIQNELGKYSTPIKDDSWGRLTNIKVASGRLNGKVLMPGQQISVSKTILPRTYDNGYRTGIQFNNGNNEEVIGGGVCQVSTTLYGALLRSELQIDERHPHSMVISYSAYSTDAAIASGSKDLVFTNNQATPIYIQGYVSSGRLYFVIYGQETRPANRTLEFKSVTVSKKTTPDKTIEDPSKPVGYKKSTGSHHPAVTSYLDKIVYIDGAEVSRERISYDTYAGSYVTTVVGTKQTAPVPVEEPVPATE